MAQKKGHPDKTPRVQGTPIWVFRASILGIVIMVLGRLVDTL